MFRKIDNHKQTASVNKNGLVVAMFDDGWEDLVDFKMECGSEEKGRAFLIGRGYEGYDPNAALKAAGLVWNGSCYAKPGEPKPWYVA